MTCTFPALASLGENLILAAGSSVLLGVHALVFQPVGVNMSGPGAVQLFMFLICCWTSAAVMVTGSCSGRFLWTALRFCNPCASVLCVFSS